MFGEMPVWIRAGDLAAQDRDLMPEYQDFHVLGNIAAGEEHAATSRTTGP